MLQRCSVAHLGLELGLGVLGPMGRCSKLRCSKLHIWGLGLGLGAPGSPTSKLHIWGLGLGAGGWVLLGPMGRCFSPTKVVHLGAGCSWA